MSDDLDNIAVVSFDDPGNAYQALSRLKELDADGRLTVRSAAVVERDETGRLQIKESVDTETGTGMAGGGLIGMLVGVIGVIGGPLGMLLGAGSGALVGGAFDVDRAISSDEVLAGINQLTVPGATLLLAEVVEPAPQVLDDDAAELGGTVTRRPTAEVMAELEAADDAAEAAQAEARRQLHAEKRAEFKGNVAQRTAALRDKLHRRGTSTAAAGASASASAPAHAD